MGINSVIYKKIIILKKGLNVVVLLGCGVCPCGWGLGPVMFSWLGELVPEFWLTELDLLSLKGSAVSSFGVSMGSVLEISSRKLEIPREHFMQRWA